MKKLKHLTMILTLLLVSCGSGAPYTAPEPVPVIDTSFPVSINNTVYYGDSITWLCYSYESMMGINRTVAGSRSYELLPLVEHYAPLDKDTEYYIMIGVADLWVSDEDKYIESMKGILNALEGAQVNVFSILPTNGIWHDNKIILGFNNKLWLLTYDYKFNFIDVYWDFMVDGVLDPELTDDGLHLNVKGCEKLFN